MSNQLPDIWTCVQTPGPDVDRYHYERPDGITVHPPAADPRTAFAPLTMWPVRWSGASASMRLGTVEAPTVLLALAEADRRWPPAPWLAELAAKLHR